MSKIKFLLVCLLFLNAAFAQTRVQVKRDTVSIISGELIINNSTKGQAGYLYNLGNGVTQFKPVTNVLPQQSGNAGKFLTTEGANPFWESFSDITNIWQNDIAALEGYNGPAIYAVLPDKGIFKYDSTSTGLSVNHINILSSGKGNGSHYWIRTFDFASGGQSSGSSGDAATFVPSVTGISSSMSVGSVNASYTKVGNIINLSGNFTFGALTDSAQAKVSLPFPVLLSDGIWGSSIIGNGVFSNNIAVYDQNNVVLTFSKVPNTSTATYSYNFSYKTGTNPGSPTIIVSTASLSAFSSFQGSPGSPQTFTIAGSNLTASLSLTSPAGFEISKDNSAYSSSLSLAPVSGTVGTQTIYVRLSSSAAVGTVSGNITATSAGAAIKTIALSGTVNAASGPTISASVSTISGLSSTQGSAGLSQTFNIAGVNLTANVSLSASSGFELSKDGTTFSSSLNYTPTSGTLASQTVFVRITNAAASGSLTGTITISSTGATSQTIQLIGYVNSGVVGGSSKFRLSRNTPTTLSGWTDLVGDPGNVIPTVTDNSSGYGLRSTGIANWNKNWGGTCVNDTLGQATSDGSGFYFPAEAIKTGYYNYQTLSTSGKYQLELFNLNPSKTYRITLVGSVRTDIGVVSPPLVTEYVVMGASMSASQSLNVWGNTSQITQFSPITPASNGTIDIGIYKPASGGGSIGVLNAIQVEEVGSSSPTVDVSSSSISGFYSVAGVAGTPLTATVSGSFLTGNITVTAPAKYEVSKDGNSYSSSVTYTPVSGTVASQNLYIRIMASASVGAVTGTLTVSSAGATQKTISLSGSCVSNAVGATAKFRCNATTPTAFAGWTDLVGDPGNATPTVTDATTGFGLRSTGTANWNKTWGQTCANGSLGQQTADANGFYFPAQAIKSGYYNYQNFSSSGTYQLELFNLNPTKTYRITIVGSIITTIGVITAPSSTEYKVLGSTASTAQNLNVWGNTSQYVQFSSITPSTSGTIKIAVFRLSDGSAGKFGVINAIQVEEML